MRKNDLIATAYDAAADAAAATTVTAAATIAKNHRHHHYQPSQPALIIYQENFIMLPHSNSFQIARKVISSFYPGKLEIRITKKISIIRKIRKLRSM